MNAKWPASGRSRKQLTAEYLSEVRIVGARRLADVHMARPGPARRVAPLAPCSAQRLPTLGRLKVADAYGVTPDPSDCFRRVRLETGTSRYSDGSNFSEGASVAPRERVQ
jgi:hypothetical protein